MFNYKNIVGLSLLASVAALSGCGGSAGGSQEPLLNCEDGLALDSDTGQCVVRPFVCQQSGFALPADFPADQTPTQADCIPPDFSGPDPVYLPAADEAVIYYNRQGIDAEYDGWVLHLFNCGDQAGWPDSALTTWPSGPLVNGDTVAGTSTPDRRELPTAVPADGIDPIYGAFWILPIEDAAECGNYIVHENFAGGDQSADLSISLSGTDRFARMAFYQPSGTGTAAGGTASEQPFCLDANGDGVQDAADCVPPEPPARRIAGFDAHWIDANTVAWSTAVGATDVALWASSTGGMIQDDDGNIIAGGGVDEEGNTRDARIVSMLTAGSFTAEQQEAYPHLTGDGWGAYTLDDDLSIEELRAAVNGQLLFVGTDGGSLLGSFVQKQRLLDAIYTSDNADAPLAESATLGLTYADGTITAAVWAPTARSVVLGVFSASQPKQLVSENAMTLDATTGVWTFSGPAANLDGLYYRYSISVFDPVSDSVRNVESTDPYSVSLDTDGVFSQFIDLNSDATKPAGWDAHTIPEIAYPERGVIYEGHVRDFSIRDESTSEANRGKYLAFTEENSAPVQHLQELVDNGLTHFHILPTFDIATVVEEDSFVIGLNDTVARVCTQLTDIDICSSDSPAFVSQDTMTIQELLESYDSTTPAARELVSALENADGFNWGYDPHHFNAPEGSYSSNPEGSTRILEMRTMIQALHEMGLRVVLDVVYNHTSESGLDNVRSNFDKFVPGYYYRRDPISGAGDAASCCEDTAAEHVMFGKFMQDSLVQWADQYKIDSFRFDLMVLHPLEVIEDSLAAVQAVDPDNYFYGEGWNSFGGSGANDAIFERATQANSGGTGIGTFNDVMREPLRNGVLFNGNNANAVRAGLAGNLADYEFFPGFPASSVGAYTQDPQENIAYVTVHDNETLWDFLQMEGTLPEDLVAADRARAQLFTLSVPLLSQGVSFVHMGADILRSKSFDENSFNSGDWFNYVDFTQTDNNWNVGLPNGQDAPAEGSYLANILASAETDPSSDLIAWSSDAFNNMLQVSTSSRLFSLTTEQQVVERLGFHNQGVTETRGMIVMSIDDGITPASMFDNLDANIELEDLDPNYDAVVVIFNGTSTEQTHTIATATGFELNSIQAGGVDMTAQGASFDDATSTFTVPALTTAVFVKPQGGSQGYGLWRGATTVVVDASNPYNMPIFVRGGFNDWGTANEAVFRDNSGLLTAFIDITAGSYEFKVASADWTAYNFGLPTSEMFALDNDPTTLVVDDNDDVGNISLVIPADGEYRFDIDPAGDPNAPLISARNARTYGDTPIFLRGGINDWGTTDEMVYIGDGRYQAVISTTVPADPGTMTYEFKAASEDWSIDLGASSDETTVELDGTAVLAQGGGNLNAVFETNDYVFTLDTFNPEAPELSFAINETFGGTPVFVRGGFNGWGAVPEGELTFQGGALYTVDITMDVEEDADMAPIPMSYNFKIADADWAAFNFGGESGTDSPVRLNNPFTDFVNAGDSGNLMIIIPQDGTYRFSVDSSSGTMSLVVELLPEVTETPL